MNESQLHTHIYARSLDLLAGGSSDVVVGPGDDAAVIRSMSGDLSLLCVDQLVEGRHFESTTDIDLIARKAIARSVSDIAAMGGTPSWSLAAGVLPKDYAYANELFDALSRWAKHWGCPLIGGDIAAHCDESHPLTLSVTVGGTMEMGTNPVLRSGARPGDRLYISGSVGNSFASEHHLRFDPQIETGHWAASSNAHAMMDVSDGVGRDSDRIAKASNVRIEIQAADLPMSNECTDWKQAVAEGEDYELLIALDPKTSFDDAPVQLLGPIGIVRACTEHEKPGSRVIDPGGNVHDGSELGWDH
ncbi:MAG: thiamine-phosphate kinase [Phycisphaerales bacterium]|nr:thiamine-phosphate kinase [Phycisphaerales bacterium]